MNGVRRAAWLYQEVMVSRRLCDEKEIARFCCNTCADIEPRNSGGRLATPWAPSCLIRERLSVTALSLAARLRRACLAQVWPATTKR